MIDVKQIEIANLKEWRRNIFFSPADETKIAIVENQLDRLIKLYNNLPYRLLENPVNTYKIISNHL